MPLPRPAPTALTDETTRRAPQPVMPRRGRHPVGLARIPLHRLAVGRAPRPEAPRGRFDRRREQLPLPPGFVDRRAPR